MGKMDNTSLSISSPIKPAMSALTKVPFQSANGSHHLGTNLLRFYGFSVTGLLQLIILLNGGTTIDIGLNEALNLFDEGAFGSIACRGLRVMCMP